MSESSPTLSPDSSDPTAQRGRLAAGHNVVTFAMDNTEEGARERATTNRQQALMARRANQQLDTSSFAAENYRPEYYIRQHIMAPVSAVELISSGGGAAGSEAAGVGSMQMTGEEAINSAVRTLAVASEKSTTELKKAVFKNYNDFLAVSEQIVRFQGGLEEMGQTVSRLKTAFKALNAAAGMSSVLLDVSVDSTSDDSGDQTQQQQQQQASAATGATVSAEEMQARKSKMDLLAASIVGFEEHATNSDRYLVFEGASISEVVGSSSPQPITLFLFNDAVAMATRRPGRLLMSASSKRMNLERLWLLKEVTVSDVADTSSFRNAFKISRSGEYVLLVAETDTGKRLWMQQIAKVMRSLEDPDTAHAAAGVSLRAPADAGSATMTPSGALHSSPALSNSPAPSLLVAAAVNLTSSNQASSSSSSPLLLSSTAGSPRSLLHVSEVSSAGGRISPSMQSMSRKSPTAVGTGSDAERDEETLVMALDDESYRTLSGLVDQLKEATSICYYDRAVELVDKIRYDLNHLPAIASTLSAPSLMRIWQDNYYDVQSQLDAAVTHLARFLYHEISSLIIDKDNMARNIQRLVALGLGDAARERFLSARSDYIKDKVCHLRFVGDVSKTIDDMAFVTFSAISTTAEWYMAAFDESFAAASLVFWAKLEIRQFVSVAIEQMLTAGAPSSIDSIEESLNSKQTKAGSSAVQLVKQEKVYALFGECFSIMQRHCSGLGHAGLDLSSFLDDLLNPHIDRLLALRSKDVVPAVQSAVSFDDFMNDKKEIAFETVHIEDITTSAMVFYQQIYAFLDDVNPMLQHSDGELLMKHLTKLFEVFSTVLVERTFDKALMPLAHLNVIGNVHFLCNRLLPTLAEQLRQRFNRSFASLARLYARIDAAVRAMYDDFSEFNAIKIVPPSELSDCYAENAEMGPLPDDASISSWLSSQLGLIGKMSRDAGSGRREGIMRNLLSHILQRLSSAIRTRNLNMPANASSAGFQQFLLDMHFLMRAFSPFLDDQVVQLATRLMNLAFSSISTDGDVAALPEQEEVDASHETIQYSVNMRPKEWYDERAGALLRLSFPINFGN